MAIRSLNWQKLRNRSQLLLFTSKAKFRMAGGVSFSMLVKVHRVLTLFWCCLNISSRWLDSRNILSLCFVFLSCSCSRRTLSVTSLIMRMSLILPSISALVLVSTTVRYSASVSASVATPILILNMADSPSKVYRTSVRLRTLYPNSLSYIDLLWFSWSLSIFSATDAKPEVFNSWRQRQSMMRYWLACSYSLSSTSVERVTPKKLSATLLQYDNYVSPSNINTASGMLSSTYVRVRLVFSASVCDTKNCIRTRRVE